MERLMAKLNDKQRAEWARREALFAETGIVLTPDEAEVRLRHYVELCEAQERWAAFRNTNRREWGDTKPEDAAFVVYGWEKARCDWMKTQLVKSQERLDLKGLLAD